MRKYLKTNIVVSVHPEGENPVFSDSATHVCVDDLGEGAFIVLKQTGEESHIREVRLDFKEFEVIAEVVSELFKQKTLKY